MSYWTNFNTLPADAGAEIRLPLLPIRILKTFTAITLVQGMATIVAVLLVMFQFFMTQRNMLQEPILLYLDLKPSKLWATIFIWVATAKPRQVVHLMRLFLKLLLAALRSNSARLLARDTLISGWSMLTSATVET